ncbi:MAG: hypothetical protein VKL39_04095 [Leptolyngbyaceae bacterium]|nr:hypothetical protein [Leptolyngbyaceae bacterium]
MKRREYLRGMGAIALFPLIPPFAHTPFPQWKVYRKLHLFVVVNREDAAAYELGRAIAHTLAEEIPESRAMVTRARDALRLASLISTEQLDVALVSTSELMAWQDHQPPYDQLQPVHLNKLFEVNDYVLISRDDFLPDHAAWIKETLQAHLSR